MAFATSNVKLDTAGSGWAMSGSWTGSLGDTAGTYVVGGAFVKSVAFNIFDTQTGADRPVPTSLSTNTTTGKTTITVYNKVNVTTGRFRIEYI